MDILSSSTPDMDFASTERPNALGDRLHHHHPTAPRVPIDGVAPLSSSIASSRTSQRESEAVTRTRSHMTEGDYNNNTRTTTMTSGVDHVPLARSMPLESWSAHVPLPPTNSFSSSPTSVVPIIADRISLPDALNIIPLERVLPPDIADRYKPATLSAILRDPVQVYAMNAAAPLRAPRVAGSRPEYVKLVQRAHSLGMFGFTADPKAVNGVFAVGKDADSDRLIIDAQPANRLFVDSPHVALPNPSHLVQIQVPQGAKMYSGKTDLSNFYHHLGMPECMREYFALPPLTPAELAACGLPLDAAYPVCLTLPMGFSHAVFLAQTAHTHLLYGSGALDIRDSVLHLADGPQLSHDRVQHGVVIDDFFVFSLNQAMAQRVFDRVLQTYIAAGFVVKQSKVVPPTSSVVKIIGFEVCGDSATIGLSQESMHSLAMSTLAVLHRGRVSGVGLSHIIGRWTWLMLLRRPSLAILQHVYRYMQLAKGRLFTLWPSVRRELLMLLGVLPLLHANLTSGFFHRVIASDASELAGGVVTTPLDASTQPHLWAMCSTRHHATTQAILNTDAAREGMEYMTEYQHPLAGELIDCARYYDSFYRKVESSPWTTIISTAWRAPEHINVLELRAALLAVHWTLSFPTALNRRVFLLLDSSAAFFSLWKGRSSSPALLLVLRKISALVLAGGLSLLPGWIPSAVNPADEPSRRLS